MSKKGWYGLVLFSLFFLVSCQQAADVPEGYYSFEEEKVNEAVNQASFNPDIPAYVPIPVEFIIYDLYSLADTGDEALDISFYSKQNDFVTYQVTVGTFDIDSDAEDVKIDPAVLAYYSDNGFAKKLMWEKDGLSYKLEYRPNVIGEGRPSQPISKDQLMKVAQSSLS